MSEKTELPKVRRVGVRAWDLRACVRAGMRQCVCVFIGRHYCPNGKRVK